ncbi:MAG: hypothetical protein AB1659_13510, partial [Thermodesulfobacteriota bacterium]
STRSFPWVMKTILESGKDHSVIRLDVFPGKRCLITSKKKAERMILVIDGKAEVFISQKNRILKRGDGHTVMNNSAIRIENIGDDTLRLLEVGLFRQH